MLKIGAPLRVALFLAGLCVAGGMLAGCSGKDDAASSPGYYSGPMQPKSPPKLPAAQGGNSAAGQP
jgi:hypothetical protein